jgi:predicted phage replisome organizer
MSSITWIKIKTNIFDDEKIKLIDALPERDAIFVIWIKLLTLAGKINDSGQVYLSENLPYNAEMFSTIFNRPISIIRMALDTFESFKMIERNNDFIGICNWEKHQNIDELNKIRESTKNRVAKYREKKKLGQCNVTVTKSNAVDKNRIDKKREEKKERKTFTPPTLEEVKKYCSERKNTVDPQKWHDHYTSNGWLVGRNKMKDWKAAVRTWERSNYNSHKPEQPARPRANSVSLEDYKRED